MDTNAIEKIKRSYLNEDFRFFHLKDKRVEEHIFHYHDFNKIVIFISGDATYVVEGKYYKLKPWDILFVGSNEIHKPIINPREYYERIIIWVNSNFLEEHSDETGDLLNCFKTAARDKNCLVRSNPDRINTIKEILFTLERAVADKDFGTRMLQNACFIQLIIHLNRSILKFQKKRAEGDIQFDERTVNILAYINDNLDTNLSVASIAERFYINKHYLMHNFKKHTGYTLHSYILQKRLARATMLIKSGMQTGVVADRCGFQDYSSFVRAFKKNFGLSPRQYNGAISEIDGDKKNTFRFEDNHFEE